MIDDILTVILVVLCIGLFFQNKFSDKIKKVYPFLLAIVGILTIIFAFI